LYMIPSIVRLASSAAKTIRRRIGAVLTGSDRGEWVSGPRCIHRAVQTAFQPSHLRIHRWRNLPPPSHYVLSWPHLRMRQNWLRWRPRDTGPDTASKRICSLSSPAPNSYLERRLTIHICVCLCLPDAQRSLLRWLGFVVNWLTTIAGPGRRIQYAAVCQGARVFAHAFGAP
jgi:hypothetical protein